jgi:50S ribosomal protein L16 3-hydroxylase
MMCAARMFMNWTGDLGAFFRDHYQKTPLARPDVARDAGSLFSWIEIGGLLDRDDKPDMLIVRNNHLAGEKLKSSEEANAVFAAGYSIVLRRLERHSPRIAALAKSVETSIEGSASVQAYATPGGYFSFGWHYDCEDVFIVQIDGTKEYLLRENTVNPAPRLDAMPRDMQYEKETTPAVAATLVAGDFLYIPSGWWHMAKASDDALSLSIGLLSPRAGGGPPQQGGLGNSSVTMA